MRNLFLADYNIRANAIRKAIREHMSSEKTRFGKIAQDYYEYKHDILKHRIFFIDENDKLVEDKYASNVRIPHPFFTEIVDQSVQYLLSNDIEYEVEDNQLQEYLKEYLNEAFNLMLQEVLEGSSIRGHEYVFARTNSRDILEFQVVESTNAFTVEQDDEKVTIRYWYERRGKDRYLCAEFWDDTEVTFFTSKNGKTLMFDNTVEFNPRKHVIAFNKKNQMLARSYELHPFFKLTNNRKELSDLKPIKALIDDYDLMSSFLSNNLHDFTDAIFVVKGYEGDDLTKLSHNIRNKKAVRVDGEHSGVDVKTIQIPTEARVKKLDIDKEAIYKFGMGFNNEQIGDGNITNVVIKSRYALLDMKANKKEVRLKELVKWCLDMIVADINRRHSTSYKTEDIAFSFIRESVVDTKEIADIELIEAQVKQSAIQTILSVAGYIDEESVLEQICDLFELDYEEVQKKMDNVDHRPLGLTNEDE